MDVIKYAFDTEGVGEIEHTFQVDLVKVLSVNVRSEDNQVLVDLEVEQVFDGDDIADFNEFFVNWSVAFGFECGVPVRNLRNCGHSLPKREGSRNYQINAGPLCFPLPKEPLIPNEKQLNNVRQLSEELTGELAMYLRQFAFANSEPDAISRYSFLYNLLLQIAGDNQAKVDVLILEVDPNCEQTISPNNGKPETVYTRLRNELAHKRVGSKYSETKKMIRQKIEEFSGIVKKVILNKNEKNS